MSRDKPTGKKNERVAHLRWVPLTMIRVNPQAQRQMNQARVDYLAANFDPEQFGAPTVNHRADDFYDVLDGQHRVAAYRVWLGEGNWEDQQIQCWTYEGLSDEEAADVFLKLNDTLAVNAFEKFQKAVNAGWPEQSDVARIVRAQGLHISRDATGGSIRATGTLMRIYRTAGPPVLVRTLRIAWAAYGDPGLDGPMLDGIALLCHRYGSDLDDERAVTRLGAVSRGAAGLLQKAEVLRKQTGSPRRHCVAAAAQETYNAGRGGKKLPSWWKD